MHMRKLNKIESLTYIIGGILMVAGAGCYALLFQQDMASLTCLVGAIGFSTMQLRQTYTGTNITTRRLRNIMHIAELLFVVSGLLMVEERYSIITGFLKEHPSAYITVVNVTYGKWVVMLLVGAILETYTIHRISNELEKDNNEKRLKE